MFDLNGTVSVVIGGNGVLGGAMSAGLAEAGSRTAIVGRDREKGERVCQDIWERGGEAQFFQA